MKQILIVLLAASGILLAACDKTDTLPTITPTTIFSVSSLKHTTDTLNLGDSIYFTASGKIFDTTNTITASLKMIGGSTNATGVFTSANTVVDAYVLKPVKVVISAASGTSPLYNWTAKFGVPGPSVARKTSVLTTASFENSLSLSSETGTPIVNDSKAVYIK
jgi:hypothetical protein